MKLERTYKHPNNPNLDMSARNRLHTQSIGLLNLISEEFLVDPFNSDNIKELFNTRTWNASSPIIRVNRFGESHLGYLVSIGALDYDSNTGIYLLNPNSPYLGHLIN